MVLPRVLGPGVQFAPAQTFCYCCSSIRRGNTNTTIVGGAYRSSSCLPHRRTINVPPGSIQCCRPSRSGSIWRGSAAVLLHLSRSPPGYRPSWPWPVQPPRPTPPSSAAEHQTRRQVARGAIRIHKENPRVLGLPQPSKKQLPGRRARCDSGVFEVRSRIKDRAGRVVVLGSWPRAHVGSKVEPAR